MDFKSVLKDKEGIPYQYMFFLKWLIIAVVSGGVIGLCGTGFHVLLDLAAELRTEHSFLLFILPVGGVLIVFLYKAAGLGDDKGTNTIIKGARGEEIVSIKKAPLIVMATFITHLLGGSAGREGAALQLGGSLVSPLKKPLKLSDDDYSVLIMCGMAAGFSALFGTPIAAAVFAMEVTVIGAARYSAIIPCIISSLTAAMVANAFGVPPTAFTVLNAPAFSSDNAYIMLPTIILGICCALISILFCIVMSKAGSLYKKFFPN
ncbi:MAG: chloride channel protein, partial [Huintestinicola sp.]